MALNAFTVVSEFKFDVANAVMGTQRLQDSVDGLSQSVSNAMDSVQALGIGFMMNFTGASAGILGLLKNAIGSSDKFTHSQLSFVQIIDSNMAHLTGSIGTMNDKMLVSQKIMSDIADDAKTFGLPVGPLAEMTKTLSAMLVPKGLAGENFGDARSMSRNLMKSAPSLGINSQDVQGQLLRAIEGSASMGDTLFRRLLSEAPEPFKQAGIKDAKGFNALDAAKRFNILNESLNKFSKNSDILAARANTFSGMMQTLQDLFTSFNGVLKPLGDVVLKPLLELFRYAISYIDGQGRKLVESVAKFIKPLIDSPKELLLDLMQLQALGKNVARAAGITAMIVGMVHLREVLTAFSHVPIINRIANPLNKLFTALLNIPVLGTAINWFVKLFQTGPITSFGSLLRVIMGTMVKMTGVFAIFLIPLLGLQRALDRIKLDSMEWFANNMPALIDAFASLRNSMAIFLAPINDMIDGFSNLFYIMLGGTSGLDTMKDTLETIAEMIGYDAAKFLDYYAAMKGVISGFMGMWMQAILNIGTMVGNLLSGNFSNITEGTDNIFGEFMKNGAEEFMRTVDKYRTPTLTNDGVDGAKVVNSVNNYDVTMNNSFKEVLQPDRIAFTIQSQLEKASTNRKSSGGASFGEQQARSI